MLIVIGFAYEQRCPDVESRIILYSSLLSTEKRIMALSFMFGIFPAVVLMFAALNPQFGAVRSDLDLARRFLAVLACGKYDHSSTTILSCSPPSARPHRHGHLAACAAHVLCARAACVGARLHAHASRACALADSRRTACAFCIPHVQSPIPNPQS